MSEIEDMLDFASPEELPEEVDSAPEEISDSVDDVAKVEAALQNQLDALQDRLEEVEQLVRVEDTFPKVFIAKVNTDNTFEELCILNGTQSTFASGRAGTGALLGSDQAIVVETEDPPSTGWAIMSGGGGGGGGGTSNGGTIGVLVQWVDDDDDGYPLYDVFALTDTSLTTPLNGDPLTPENGRWRGAPGISITAAEDGSRGTVIYDEDGIHLMTDAETVCANDGGFGWGNAV